jgi:hypothetical protein
MLRKDERRAAAVGAHHHVDRQVGERDPRIARGDKRIVPARDLAPEHARIGFARELDGVDPLEVVREDDAARGHRKQLHATGNLGHVFGLHGRIAGAEVDGAIDHAWRAVEEITKS